MEHTNREMRTDRLLLELAVSVAGIFLTAFIIVLFNRYFLMGFSLPWRMVLMIVSQWALLLAPMAAAAYTKSWGKLGFSGKCPGRQVLIGIVLALGMSAVFTVLPILCGWKSMVGSTSYTRAWQFAYDFVYKIFGVALAEELVFRGYLYARLMEVRNSKWFAILVSSALFGLFHIWGGNVIQMAATGLLGILFCVFRSKIKNCTTLSLIVAHGIYDALITLWCGVL